MTILDPRKDFKILYAPPSKAPVIVDVPEMNFLMVDGHGDPNTSAAYADALQALYSVAYTLKFMLKKGAGMDFGVAPLEGLWWAADLDAFANAAKDEWDWTMMIMQPPQITPDLVSEAIHQAAAKKDLPAVARMRFDRFHEGLCAQIMYIGPFAAEGATIERLHAFIHAQGYTLRDKHHEIYLSDPRRAAPDKLKTVIRQPMQPVGIPQLVIA